MVKRKLRILQVSTADIRGGAEKIAWNLFTKYRERGYDSCLAVGEKRSNDPDVLILPNQEMRGRWYHFFRRLASRYQKIEAGICRETLISRLAGGLAEPGRRLEYHLGMEDFRFPASSSLLTLNRNRPDILHAHNLHGAYFDLRMLPSLSQQVPMVITLHDAWLLSGHCAHSFDCENWKSGCGKCPDLTIYPAVQRDATHYNWLRKKKIYSQSHLYVATPSNWLMSKIEQSMLAPAIVEARVIPNGVDLSIFHPAERHEIREKLGIRSDVQVLLAMGVQIRENIWKDYHTLRLAVANLAERLEGQDILLLALGEEAPVERIGQVEIRFIPYQEDSRAVARFCQASDIYVHSARTDTFPTGVIEALACGTPVVATATGGIPEQIEDSQNGYLTSPGDAAGMANRIMQLLSDHALRQAMGAWAAERAGQKFNLDRQADTYLDWYEEVLEAQRLRHDPRQMVI
jgi:glycosyltransferase involved in cell wall biosynthesis